MPWPDSRRGGRTPATGNEGRCRRRNHTVVAGPPLLTDRLASRLERPGDAAETIGAGPTPPRATAERP